MRLALSLYVAAVLVTLSAASFVQLEHDQSVSHWQTEGWKKLQKVEESTTLTLTFALKQQNTEQLERFLLQVSDPKSPLYGKYLTSDEVTELVAPSPETLRAVLRWIESHGIEYYRVCTINANHDFLVCTVACGVAEKLLTGTVFHYFSHVKLAKQVIRSVSSYYVPSEMKNLLDFVGGVHRFPAVNWGKSKDEEKRTEEVRGLMQDGKVGVHVGVYPKVLREKYNLTATDIGNHPNNSQLVAQFLEQYYSESDLHEFFSLFVGGEFKHVTSMAKVVGPNKGRSGIEASLDTQYITSMGANIPTWFWSTGGRHEKQEPFLEWLVDVSNTSQVPWVMSISYGDVEESLSTAYMKRVSVEFMKAGVRGISIFVASGDDGASCKEDTRFAPSFPASSPYVTTVGGSGLKNPFSISDEDAVDFSGGGFSNVFDAPAYQTEAVERYFQHGTEIPEASFYNKTGRAYPDIAALARHYWIINNRVPAPGVMGTSASTPVVAGMIALINDHRLAAKKPTMGFLNPFIYQNTAALYDVVKGCNQGCTFGLHDQGFCSGKEWDPVTGNGTPKFYLLLKAAMLAVQ